MQAKFNDRRSTVQKACDWAYARSNELCLTVVLAMVMLCEPLADLILFLVYLN